MVGFSPIRKQGEPYQEEYDEIGATPKLSRIGRKMERDIQRQFDGLARRIENADSPLMLSASIAGQQWWLPFVSGLQSAIAAGVVPSAEVGTQTAEIQVGVEIDWTLVRPEAIAFAQQYGLQLATQVTQSLIADIRTIVASGIERGESMRQITDRIVDSTGLADWRAGRIARTEVIRAHSQGAIAGYMASGQVQGVRWLDNQPGACELCQALHNEIRPLGVPFYAGPGGGLPPRHPHCRCAVSPVLIGG